MDVGGMKVAPRFGQGCLGGPPVVVTNVISPGFGWMTPEVVGKLFDRVYPLTQALPELSTATAVAQESFLVSLVLLAEPGGTLPEAPPKYVE